MDSTAAPANPIRHLGWITQIVGALALLRLISEYPVMNPTWGHDYWGMVGADLVLGFIAFTAGWAFRRGKKGSWAATCVFWGAATAISVAILIWLGPFMVREVSRGAETSGDFLNDSRILVYALILFAAPYVLWAMGSLPGSPQRPSWLTRCAWMLAGAAGALVFFFVVISQP